MNPELRSRILKGATLAGVVIGLYLLALGWQRPSIRLANGTELSLLGVTHGPSNIFFPGSLLDRLICRFAPVTGIQFGPIKIPPVGPMLDDGWPVGLSNRAVLWIGHRGPSNAPALPVSEEKWFSDIRATLADEKGEEWDMPAVKTRLWPARADKLNWVSSWDFTSFPRRGKTLRFRIYALGGLNQWNTLADFTLPNPMPGPYPNWKPSPLPDTKISGNLEVSLIGLVSGAEGVAYYPGVRPFTRATFAVKENGQPTEAWLPVQMEESDATGNVPWLSMIMCNATNRLVSYEIQCASLSPSEVWKMRTRFCKERDPDRKPLWTSPDLVVQAGALLKMNLRTNVQSFLITLECGQSFPNTIRFKLETLPKDTRLLFPTIVDDQGRSAEYESGFLNENGFDAQWKIPKGAKWLKVTITVAETRTFEFLAQPTSLLRTLR